LPIAWQREQFSLTRTSPLLMRVFSAALVETALARRKATLAAIPSLTALKPASEKVRDGTRASPLM
jgi:hypothetical protein